VRLRLFVWRIWSLAHAEPYLHSLAEERKQWKKNGIFVRRLSARGGRTH